MSTTRIARTTRTTRMPPDESDAPIPAPQTTLSLVPSSDRPPTAWLVCPDLPRLPLGAKPVITIGRKPDADLVLPHHAVSQHHAVLKVRGRLVQIEDEGSSNGTHLNGRRIQTGVIKPGVVIGIGPYNFEIELPAGASGTGARARADSRPIKRPPPPERRETPASRKVRRPPPPPTPRPPIGRPAPAPTPAAPSGPQTVLEGDLGRDSIIEAFHRIEIERWSGQLVVATADEVAGEVCVVEGKPLRATLDDLEGEDAVLGILALRGGSFTFALAPLEGTPWRTTLAQLIREAELQREWLEGYSGVSDVAFIEQLEYSDELGMGAVAEAPPVDLEPHPIDEDSGYQTEWESPARGSGPLHDRRPVYEEDEDASEPEADGTDESEDELEFGGPLGSPGPGSEAYRRADDAAKTGDSRGFSRSAPGSEVYLRAEVPASDMAPYDGGDDYPSDVVPASDAVPYDGGDDFPTDVGAPDWDSSESISDAAIAAIADAETPEATEAAILAATRELDAGSDDGDDGEETDDLAREEHEPFFVGIDSDSVDAISRSLREASLRAVGETELEGEPAAPPAPVASVAAPASAAASGPRGGLTLAVFALVLGVVGGAAGGTWWVAERGAPAWLPWKASVANPESSPAPSGWEPALKALVAATKAGDVDRAARALAPLQAARPSAASAKEALRLLDKRLADALSGARSDDARRVALRWAGLRARLQPSRLSDVRLTQLIDALQESEDPQAVFEEAPAAFAHESAGSRRKVATAMFRAVERRTQGAAVRLEAVLMAIHLLRVDADGRLSLPELLEGLRDRPTRSQMHTARALAFEQLNQLKSAERDLLRAKKYADPKDHARVEAHLARIRARR